MKVINLEGLTDPNPPLADALEFAIAHARVCKLELAQAVARDAEAQAHLVQLLKERGEKVVTTDLGGGLQATLVEAERLKIDETKLRTTLDPVTWRSVSTRKLDKERLEQAVAEEAWLAETVASCSELVTNKPYVRITEHQSDGD